jgi:hypothetical protein
MYVCIYVCVYIYIYEILRTQIYQPHIQVPKPCFLPTSLYIASTLRSPGTCTEITTEPTESFALETKHVQCRKA